MVSRVWLCADGMRQRVAIIAALPREISGLVKKWRKESANGMHVFQNQRAIVVCGGMGVDRAMIATGEALSRGPISIMISAGFAGALHGDFKVGQIARPRVVIDSRTGERFTAESGEGVLVTGGSVANVREKARLRASYGADIVDMEAAAVARVATARGVPFSVVKAVSDESDFEMPELEKFATASGEFREAAFTLFLMTRPRLWGNAMRLARGGKLAMKTLTSELRGEIERLNV